MDFHHKSICVYVFDLGGGYHHSHKFHQRISTLLLLDSEVKQYVPQRTLRSSQVSAIMRKISSMHALLDASIGMDIKTLRKVPVMSYI